MFAFLPTPNLFPPPPHKVEIKNPRSYQKKYQQEQQCVRVCVWIMYDNVDVDVDDDDDDDDEDDDNDDDEEEEDNVADDDVEDDDVEHDKVQDWMTQMGWESKCPNRDCWSPIPKAVWF